MAHEAGPAEVEEEIAAGELVQVDELGVVIGDDGIAHVEVAMQAGVGRLDAIDEADRLRLLIAVEIGFVLDVSPAPVSQQGARRAPE